MWELYHKTNEATELSEIELGSRDKRNVSVLTADLSRDLDQDENAVANMYQLLLTLTQMFNLIQKSVPEMPKSFSPLCAHVQSAVEKKFGKPAARKAIGAFIFLRFICPALGMSHSTPYIQYSFITLI